MAEAPLSGCFQHRTAVALCFLALTDRMRTLRWTLLLLLGSTRAKLGRV